MKTATLELKVLDMCEKLLPNTTMRNNKELASLLTEIRTQLEGK